MGVKFPSWLLLANNLKEIKLVRCNKCEEVQALSHLPNLTHVRMENMPNLRCLGSELDGYDQISGATANVQRNYLFPALRSLDIYDAENLIDLVEVERLRAFPCLEELTLTACMQLKSAPSHFPYLRRLRIHSLNSGVAVACILSSQLTTLTKLFIWRVRRLTSLPEGTLRDNKNLASLFIVGCPELSCVAPHGFDGCASLQLVYIESCPKLRYLPDQLLSPSLKDFGVGHCKILESIPIIPEGGLPSLREFTINNCPELSNLPEGLQSCTSIRTLRISNCPKIKSIPVTSFSKSLPSLQTLEIQNCPELSSLPSGIGCSTSLVELTITECPKVAIDGLGASLQMLEVSNLEFLPALNGGFTSLRELSIYNCNRTELVGASLHFLVSLQELEISECPYLETAPSLSGLKFLRRLKISHCPRLTSLPSGLARASPYVFTRLKSLEFGAFWEELDSFPAFEALPQLELLMVYGWPKLSSLLEEIQHLTSLTDLWIHSFDGVKAIPDWLGNLASLETLNIQQCKNVMYLPSVEVMRSLTKIKELCINCSPLLKERCREETGPEWSKISHIPKIRHI